MDRHGHAISNRRCVWVNGPIIVGAGPSGLAVGACLKEQGVPFVILERSDCIASLWQRRTYDRLKLHLPKQFCQLPRLPFPDDFPTYPSKNQFISYLEEYARHFDLAPKFNECVQWARFDDTCGLWRVCTANQGKASYGGEVEYIARWLVVATGENAEAVVPDLEGLGGFKGKVSHVCEYKQGAVYGGDRVLVVGCGNSGMEVCLDLCNHDAKPVMVVRSSVHVLPREILGKSTFETAVFLKNGSHSVLGNVEKYGLKRPEIGPLQLKNAMGKTPVLDIGALGKIKSGEIKVVPAIKRLDSNSVEFVNGERVEVDSVIFATGYRSNVPYWLQECDFFSKNGFPKNPFPNGWKGKSGLYAVGFTRIGLSGASVDAMKIAQDIGKMWKAETRQTKQFNACHRRCISQF
ncbi:hypothetical protein AMTR_s00039p00215960 [Amborella trichopoda]|uniref:Flavin-containing monooxygenase n=1 Tax=Amborella trichopoda TaxID=13333 RepID=U5CRQ1_AMBTC|nr:hypothetical protein AMTR_s00039p00215960 [Amborella trichopoda]